MNPPGNERGADSQDHSDQRPEPKLIVRTDSAGDLGIDDDEIADFLAGTTDIRPFFAAGVTRFRVGALPIADEYAKYEIATPGAGEDIRNMAKAEQKINMSGERADSNMTSGTESLYSSCRRR